MQQTAVMESAFVIYLTASETEVMYHVVSFVPVQLQSNFISTLNFVAEDALTLAQATEPIPSQLPDKQREKKIKWFPVRGIFSV